MLVRARANNARLAITGMLLYENGSFFQVLEGAPDVVDELYREIGRDQRHAKVVTIIREPIAKRSFGEWTMGYSKISTQELDEIVGLNDFFTKGLSFVEINSGRAKKLLSAYRDGRWRAKVQYTAFPETNSQPNVVSMQPATMQATKISFRFQPIIDTRESNVVAYAALICGKSNEDISEVLPLMSDQDWSRFDTSNRAIAISMAAKLGISCDLYLNFQARHIDDARSAIRSTLDAAERNGVEPSRIVLEIDQDRLIGDREQFAGMIDEYRGAGLRMSIDHFGAGQAGLTLLEIMRPELISLDALLVRDIDSNGPRQAIVRGVRQTCVDLGIDLIAKHVETYDEYKWINNEGINLIQGNLIARPIFEQLPAATYPQN